MRGMERRGRRGRRRSSSGKRSGGISDNVADEAVEPRLIGGGGGLRQVGKEGVGGGVGEGKGGGGRGGSGRVGGGRVGSC